MTRGNASCSAAGSVANSCFHAGRGPAAPPKRAVSRGQFVTPVLKQLLGRNAIIGKDSSPAASFSISAARSRARGFNSGRPPAGSRMIARKSATRGGARS
jgi:hypothetical protein